MKNQIVNQKVIGSEEKKVAFHTHSKINTKIKYLLEYITNQNLFHTNSIF